MKTETKMNNAIERIKGYCTEVNQAQWEELVRVAHANGVDHSAEDEWDANFPVFFIDCELNQVDAHKDIEEAKKDRRKLKAVPFPDFLAKLRGEEWTPKAGEMVECRDGVGADWFLAKYVGHDGKWAVCRPEHHPLGHYTVHNDVNFRPSAPPSPAQNRKRNSANA